MWTVNAFMSQAVENPIVPFWDDTTRHFNEPESPLKDNEFVLGLHPQASGMGGKFGPAVYKPPHLWYFIIATKMD